MSDSMPPESDELWSLLEAERDVPEPSVDRRARIRAGVEHAIGLPAAPVAPGGSDPGGLTRAFRRWPGHLVTALVSLAVGAVVGASLHAALSDEQPPPAAVQAPVEHGPSQTSPLQGQSDAGVATSIRPDAAAAAAALTDAGPRTLRVRRPTRSNDSTRGTLAAERRLLDAARAAIVRGHPAEALRTLRRHEGSFENGQLVEEREVLAVQALAMTGRTQEATDRAARFREEHPGSFMIPSVQQALETTAEAPAHEGSER